MTGRNACIFAAWTPNGLKYETVLRDDEFWRSEMVGKLENFYMEYLLPEIISMDEAKQE